MKDLNCTKSRGRWYVYHRHTGVKLVSGFIGTRGELDVLIEDSRRKIAALIDDSGSRLRGKTPGWRRDAAAGLHIVTMRRAARKKLEYGLTPESIYAMLDAGSDRCAVSGLEMDYLPKSKQDKWHRRPLAPSVDRIDNGAGYVPGNVRIVCTCVNIGINEWGLDLFTIVCHAVAKQTENVLQNSSFSIVSDGSKNVA